MTMPATNRLAELRAESELLASLRDMGTLQLVRSRAPVEIREKRQEAKALQTRASQLLAEASQIEAVLLAAGGEASLPNGHTVTHPYMAEDAAA